MNRRSDSDTPPTRSTEAPSTTRRSTSISPIRNGGTSTPNRNGSSTPNTEFSVSPMRRSSSVDTKISRGVSPLDSRRGTGTLDNIREERTRTSSPATQPPQEHRTGRHPHRYSLSNLPQQQPQIRTGRHPHRSSISSFQSSRSQPASSKRDSLPAAHVKSPLNPTDGEIQYEEVITLSPAQPSAPIQSYRRATLQSQTRALSLVSENGSPDVYQPTGSAAGSRRSSTINLNKVAAGGSLGRAYFGQKVSQFDLIANNIENAFDAMR